MKKAGMGIATILCVFTFCILYSVNIQRDLSQNLLRLHIIANSNSDNDQQIKLSVRDEILKEIKYDTGIDELNNIAESKLKEYGVKYGAAASYERCFVPCKKYKNIRLPRGVYNCVRVVLGEGGGENWWCVAYPPLCFTEEVFGNLSSEGEAQLKNALTPEAVKTIINDGNVNFRFKIVDDMQKLLYYRQKSVEN